MKDWAKKGLYVVLILLGLVLFNKWQSYNLQNQSQTDTKQPSTQISTVPASKQASSSTVPSINSAQLSTPPSVKHHQITDIPTQQQVITVNTDNASYEISLTGGNIVNAKLNNYATSKTNKQPLTLLSQNPTDYYVAQSGVTGSNGPDTQHSQIKYSTSHQQYRLQDGKNNLAVTLLWQGKNGLTIKKVFTFSRGKYQVKQTTVITNNGVKSWQGVVYQQLTRSKPDQHTSALNHIASFTGAAISSPENHYKKIKFDKFTKSPVSQNITGGWAAMVQQYFLSAWVPPTSENYHYYSAVNSQNQYTIGMYSQPIILNSGQTMAKSSTLYIGPAEASRLDVISPNLSLTIDYGWLWFIAKLIFWLMKAIHSVIGNWGWSIIFTTMLIKLLFYPLSDKSFKSMANMRKLQPRMEQLKQRHGDDKAGLGKATMELYKKEKVNPLSGCFPMLIQIPVFISLYWVIIQSVELRLAPWMFWIKDLSTHDPYYILPIVMGGLMLLQQKLSPAPPDPTQAKVMMLMPVMFTFFFLHFPAGLVLYWVTNTLFTILHQLFVYKMAERKVVS